MIGFCIFIWALSAASSWVRRARLAAKSGHGSQPSRRQPTYAGPALHAADAVRGCLAGSALGPDPLRRTPILILHGAGSTVRRGRSPHF